MVMATMPAIYDQYHGPSFSQPGLMCEIALFIIQGLESLLNAFSRKISRVESSCPFLSI